MEKQIQQLFDLVEERKDELIQLAADLITYETPAPPARNTTTAQKFVENYLKNLGAEIEQWELYPGDTIVVGTLKGSKCEEYRSLILNGHIDVAEVRPDEEWIYPPFKPTIKDGFLYGRGAADMKAGLAGCLFALNLLKDAGIELPGDVIVQSVTGEEVGEAGTKQCCDRGITADFALVADTSNLHVQGQGGVVTGWITVRDVETHHDAIRRNMIHAGGGMLGASAIEKMMKLLQALQELERHWAIMKHYEGCKPGTNTINPAVIEGGRHAAFIADECRVWITVHFYPDETEEQVTKEIEEYLMRVATADHWLAKNPPTFKWGGISMIEDRGEIFPSLEVDRDHPAVLTLARVHKKVTTEEAIFDISSSVTDGGWFSKAGIPAAIFGPGQFNEAHTVNEKLPIEQLLMFTKVLVQFIYEWSHTPKTKEVASLRGKEVLR